MNGSDLGVALVSSNAPVGLIGGGPVRAEDVAAVLGLTSHAVAADSGAAAFVEAGRLPDAVIGDFDSLSTSALRAIPPERLHRIAEQDSTDFEKCLSRISAPLVLATGIAGGRMDHLLAAFSTLAKLSDRRCIIVGAEDIAFLAPPAITFDVPPETTISLFPLGPVAGRSEGLRWPIDDLEFGPIAQIGTSNMSDGQVGLKFDRPSMLILLPRDHLETAIAAFVRATGWQ